MKRYKTWYFDNDWIAEVDNHIIGRYKTRLEAITAIENYDIPKTRPIEDRMSNSWHNFGMSK